MGSKVWMVGTEQSLKSNQWQAMCGSKEAADEYVAANPKFSTVKEVDVRPPRRRKA